MDNRTRAMFGELWEYVTHQEQEIGELKEDLLRACKILNEVHTLLRATPGVRQDVEDIKLRARREAEIRSKTVFVAKGYENHTLPLPKFDDDELPS